MNIILPIKDIFIIAGNIVFSVLYNEHLEFPCRCQLLSSNSEVMQELYIEKELFIKRTTENDCRAGNDSNLLIVFYVQIMPDDFVMQLHRF